MQCACAMASRTSPEPHVRRGTEAEMARTQKNKATAKHLGILKAKLSKLKAEAAGIGGSVRQTTGGQAINFRTHVHLPCFLSGRWRQAWRWFRRDKGVCTPGCGSRHVHITLAWHTSLCTSSQSGDTRVGLVGFPSVGKSTLLTKLTGTESEAASYEFTVRGGRQRSRTGATAPLSP